MPGTHWAECKLPARCGRVNCLVLCDDIEQHLPAWLTTKQLAKHISFLGAGSAEYACTGQRLRRDARPWWGPLQPTLRPVDASVRLHWGGRRGDTAAAPTWHRLSSCTLSLSLTSSVTSLRGTSRPLSRQVEWLSALLISRRTCSGGGRAGSGARQCAACAQPSPGGAKPACRWACLDSMPGCPLHGPEHGPPVGQRSASTLIRTLLPAPDAAHGTWSTLAALLPTALRWDSNARLPTPSTFPHSPCTGAPAGRC